MINPNDYVITRKRKKYKFAKFANADNCYELDEWVSRQPLADEGLSITLEIGAGTGLFSVELARRHPDKVFVALDVKADRLQKGAYAAIDQGIHNVYFVRARADQVDQIFEPGSLATIWLTFSDPFPRSRSAGRRMTHPNFLSKYRAVLTDNGELLIKHDNLEFFAWTLEQLVAENWRITELAFDLHESKLHDDYKIMTTYEQRWLDDGRVASFVKAARYLGASGCSIA